MLRPAFSDRGKAQLFEAFLLIEAACLSKGCALEKRHQERKSLFGYGGRNKIPAVVVGLMDTASGTSEACYLCMVDSCMVPWL